MNPSVSLCPLPAAFLVGSHDENEDCDDVEDHRDPGGCDDDDDDDLVTVLLSLLMTATTTVMKTPISISKTGTSLGPKSSGSVRSDRI